MNAFFRRPIAATCWSLLLAALVFLCIVPATLAQTGGPVWMRGGHEGVVNAIAFSPRASILASVGDDRTLRLWDLDTRAQLRCRGLTSAGNCLVYTDGGARILVGCYDGVVRTYDATTLELLGSHRAHGSIVYSITVTTDGARYLTSGGSEVLLRDAATDTLVQSFVGHTSDVKASAISPDGRYVLTGGTDYTVRLWDATSGALLHNFVEIMKSASAVAFSPDSRRFAVRGYAFDRDTFSVNVFTVPECAPVISFAVAQRKEILGLAFTPDGSGVASVSMDFSQDTVDRRTATVDLSSITGARGRWRLYDTVEGACIAFSPDERWMAYGSYGGWIGVIRRSADPGTWFTGSVVRPTEYHRAVSTLRLSPDEQIIAVGSDDGSVDLRSTATGSMVRRLVGHYKPVRSLDFSPDGHTLASAGTDGMVKLWNVGTGVLQRRLFLSPSAVVHAVRFIDGGRRFAGALGPPDSAVVLLDTGSNEITARMTGSGGVNAIALAPDGRRLVSGSDAGEVRLWDIATASETGARLLFDRPVLCLDVSRQNIIVCGTDDGRLAMTELGSSGTLWEQPQAHRRAITAVTFSRDGSLVGTCSADSTARIWRVEAEGLTLVRTFTDVPFGHRAMAIALDSGLVINGTQNATVLARRLAEPVGAPAEVVTVDPVRVVPNPARSSATIVFDNERAGSCTVRFIDLLGRSAGDVVRDDLGTGRQHLRIPVSTLAPGTWVLELQTPSRRERVRLVIAK